MKKTAKLQVRIEPEVVQDTLLVSLLVIVIQGAFLFFLWHQLFPLWVFLAVHGGVMIALMFWSRFMQRSRADMRLPYTLCVLVLGLGPFGAFVTFCLSLFYRLRSRYTKSFDQWFRELFPDQMFEIKDQTYENIVFGREDISSKTFLVPFRETMEYGSSDQKAEAITKILKYFRPEFSKALVIALEDPDPVVRVRAATAVATLEEEYYHASLEEEKELGEHTKEPQKFRGIAKKLTTYAECAFVDEETKLAVREKAAKLYQKFLDKDPEHELALLELANLYADLGKAHESQELLEKNVALHGIHSPHFLTTYLEILFEKRAFGKIRDLCQQSFPFLEETGQENQMLKEMVELWRVSAAVKGS